MASIFEELETILTEQSAERMTERLCDELRRRHDYHGLFYALILAERHRLGLPAVQVGGSDTIPPELTEPYEDAIREAARTVGQLFLDQGDIGSAWAYYRMIGERQPVADAIERIDLPEDPEQAQTIIEIAFHEGACPKRGFDLLLERYGICSAITTLSQGIELPADVRDHCIRRLIVALHEELRDRLRADVQQHHPELSEATIPELLAMLPESFGDDCYHIDTSHLSSVVQFSLYLGKCDELRQAIELCEYGKRLSPRFQFANDPPFEDQYADCRIYLKAVLGEDVEVGIAHFRAKAEAASEEVGTYPAEVLVNLLDRVGRYGDAVAASARYLAQADVRRLSCPSLQELCQKAGDFSPLAEVSVRRGDLVNYAAALLQMRGAASPTTTATPAS